MPDYALIQYMQAEKIYEDVSVTFWLSNRSEVSSHLEVRDWPCWFLRLLSGFYDPVTSFPSGCKFEESITKCNEIHPPSPQN